jgi:hypothetical protein
MSRNFRVFFGGGRTTSTYLLYRGNGSLSAGRLSVTNITSTIKEPNQTRQVGGIKHGPRKKKDRNMPLSVPRYESTPTWAGSYGNS